MQAARRSGIHASFAGHFTQVLFLKTVAIGILCGVIAHLFGIQPAQGAAVGLVAVVAAASNTPTAAIFMGVELFGGGSTLYVAGAAIAAYLIVGHRSVYPKQQMAYTKSSWVTARTDIPIGQQKVRLSYACVVMEAIAHHHWHLDA